MTTATPVVSFSASAQTLTLGIDRTGKILHHDRTALDILADERGSLLGSDLSALIAGPEDPAEAFRNLIEAACSDRDSTRVLTIRTASRSMVDAIVTVEPIRSTDPDLLAHVTMRMPPPAAERFIDPALMRHALFDGAVKRLGGALDIDQIAPALVNILVPHFCNAATLLVLESMLTDAEHAHPGRGGAQLVRRLALAHDDGDPAWEATFPVGEVLRYLARSLQVRCLQTSQPVAAVIDEAVAAEVAAAWGRTSVARLISGASMLLLPLLADQTMLGFFTCIRDSDHHRFDAYDTEIGMDFASRAAQFIDTARKYSRERTTALTLQRSMLPAELSAPESVEVKYRYLPGSKLIEVGGDWYESIALPGGRVALVVGDVAGHGVRAAVTMGRLRTAIKTLTMLELPAAETLQRLNDLMHELGVLEPHFATCVFAIYDSVDGSCELASAGHPPPLLVHPDGSSEFLDVSLAPPLGTSTSPIRSRTLQIDDGSILMLYTDGLVERRREDIDEGLARLRRVFAPPSVTQPLDDLCRAALADVYHDHNRDDIAILIARLRRISPDRHVSWTLAPRLTAARRARMLIRRPLRQWGLAELIPVTELAVSELVTNAVRYSQSKIGLRLVLEGGLFCEVLDDSAAVPRLRHAADDEERGRGLQVVSQISQRWGTRRTATGKIVWCELAVPARASAGPRHGTGASGRQSSGAANSRVAHLSGPADSPGPADSQKGAGPPARASSRSQAVTGRASSRSRANSPRPANSPGYANSHGRADSPGVTDPADRAKSPGVTDSAGRAKAPGRANSAGGPNSQGPSDSEVAGPVGAHRRPADQLAAADRA